jgi:hypothetical protein
MKQNEKHSEKVNLEFDEDTSIQANIQKEDTLMKNEPKSGFM